MIVIAFAILLFCFFDNLSNRKNDNNIELETINIDAESNHIDSNDTNNPKNTKCGIDGCQEEINELNRINHHLIYHKGHFFPKLY